MSGEGFASIKLVGVRWPLRGLLGGVSGDGVGVHAHWILSFGMRSRLKAAQLNKMNCTRCGRVSGPAYEFSFCSTVATAGL